MNIIDAIIHLVQNQVTEIGDVLPYGSGNNRMNSVGEGLERYIKNLFANTFNMREQERLHLWSEVFSYSGNDTNPPDAMLRAGDAIEIKKIQQLDVALALNSSFPKHVLKCDSRMISTACREAEQWTEKDLIYAVGVVKDEKLKHLAMVYGRNYCASEECYDKVRQIIKSGVELIPGVEFSNTRELGRINKVDPLKITYLRVRGMWGIENPWKVFGYIYERDLSCEFTFMCIIDDEKWATFENTNSLVQLSKTIDNLNIKNVRIKNPDNPVQLQQAKLITFYK